MNLFTKRNLLIAAAVPVLIFFALIAYLLNNGGGAAPAPTSTPVPSETPAPTPSVEVFDEDHGADGEAQSKAFGREYPVMRHLPYELPYWSVELASQDLSDGTIDLLATVYVLPNADEAGTVQKQRPYIDAWLKKVGQEPGTYELDIQTFNIDSY